MADDKPESNAKVIASFFNGKDDPTTRRVPLKSFMEEFSALTDSDKEELGKGIRNGSLTY
jgi:hypothetical protein